MSDEVIVELYEEYEQFANQKDIENAWEECFGDPAYYGFNDFDEA